MNRQTGHDGRGFGVVESVKGPSRSIPILLIESVGSIPTPDIFHNFLHLVLICLETNFIDYIILLTLYFNYYNFI